MSALFLLIPQGVDVLKILLGNDDQVQYTEWYFRSEEGINNINPFVSAKYGHCDLLIAPFL